MPQRVAPEPPQPAPALPLRAEGNGDRGAVAPASPGTRIAWNPWREIGLGIARLRKDRVLSLTVAGISYFWFLGALLQLLMILFWT